MRQQDTVEAELRLLAALRTSIQDKGGDPSIVQIDGLLDELGVLIAAGKAGGPPR